MKYGETQVPADVPPRVRSGCRCGQPRHYARPSKTWEMEVGAVLQADKPIVKWATP